MARNVFISFRFSDGHEYKEKLVSLFNLEDDVIDCSEDTDRRDQSEETIKNYLYEKLKRSSVTVVILTPEAINHQKDGDGKYNDWMYDEIRYSLEDREENRTNGLIAVYTPETEDLLYQLEDHYCDKCKQHRTIKRVNNFDNLVRKNLMNVKQEYKQCPCDGIYDDVDSYCAFVAWDDFIAEIDKYIDEAGEKRNCLYKYDLTRRLQ